MKTNIFGERLARLGRRALGAAMAAVIACSAFSGGMAFAQPSEESFTAQQPQESQLLQQDYALYLQENMRAVRLTPSVDFAVDDNGGASAEELAALFEEIAGYGMNAVMLDASADESAFYDVENGGGALSAALSAARGAGLYGYVVLDAGEMLRRHIAQGGSLKEGFSAFVHKFAMKYPCEGVILSGYYTYDTPEMYAQYLCSGSGIGYENWLYETNEYLIRTMSQVIRRTNNTIAVGLLIADMWANSASNEAGSATADTVQALYDGHCDTKRYIERGYADFALVQAYGSTSDAALNFDKVVSWWHELTQSAGAKLYMLHMNERIGQYAGWYEDQLLRQLTVMEDYDGIGGSAFNSLSSLRADPLGTTDTLLDYFAKRINTDTIFEDLTMLSPSSLSFVTYDNSVKFMGTFDENFDVFFDGEKIKLNEAGNFYFQKELEVGWNSFTFEHKGKQYKYSIERRVDVLRSIGQENDIIVEGGTRLSLVAVAYSGSKVSATIGGNTVMLKEKSGSAEELDANSSYAKFVGYYTVGDEIVGEKQYLGNISYYASYRGIEETMTGGSVTIEAAPEPPKEIVAEINPDQSSVGSGEVVGTIEPVVSSSESVQYVKVLNDFTIVYDSRTTGDIETPLFSQLPAGTLDYYKSASGGYISTTSGKRFEQSAVTTFTDTGLGYNSLFVKEIGNASGSSFIKLHLDYKSSFNVTTPVEYHEEVSGEYGVASFDAQYVYITFDNITSVTSLPSFDYCSLFSAGRWETTTENGVPKFRLVLTLRQAGIYSGCAARYNADGDLVLTFAVPTATLSGKVIVIDPGHGYGKVPDKLDPGAIGNVTEQSVNLAVAKELEKKLTAMGATVVRLKTESEFILTSTRPTVARTYGADMYVSLHCNSVENNESAHGVEVYYFTPFSQPLASAITSQLSNYYDSEVYADGTQSNRGAKYSYYWVTLQQDFPSVLVEMGFISNERECMTMANNTYQQGMAQAIANGVYAYFARSGLSYSGSGSSGADVPDVTPDEPKPDDTSPEETAPPENTDVPESTETAEPEAPSGESESDPTEESEQTEQAGQTEESEETSESPQHRPGGIHVG